MPKFTEPKRLRHLLTVNAYDLQVNPVAQREFRPAHAAAIAKKWDIEKFQEPHVNRREDGSLYIMEGQHGTHAYKEVYGKEGVDNLPVKVWIYDGLSEQEEAEFFLSLNDKKAVNAMDKFKVAVVAGHEVECDIDRIVRARECLVGAGFRGNTISAVGTLRTIYTRHGAAVLSDTIGILRDAFGDGSYEAQNLMGVAMVIARYAVKPVEMVKALLTVRAGSKGLIQQAARIRERTGVDRNNATAAALVEIYNKQHRGRARLTNWFATDEADAA